MSQKIYQKGNVVPRLNNLIEKCFVTCMVNAYIILGLDKFDSKLIRRISQKYKQGIKKRREALDISQEELAKLCSITPSFLDLIEKKYTLPNYQRLESVLQCLKYDRSLRDILRFYKQEFKEEKNIGSQKAYYNIVKNLIHEVLIYEELRREGWKIHKSTKIPLEKIHESILFANAIKVIKK